MAEIGYATSRWHEKIVEIPKKNNVKSSSIHSDEPDVKLGEVTMKEPNAILRGLGPRIVMKLASSCPSHAKAPWIFEKVHNTWMYESTAVFAIYGQLRCSRVEERKGRVR